jgi:ectoine hydroxylase-related dioxygenase (phytanoyl-CoA dioxygenase family)
MELEYRIKDTGYAVDPPRRFTADVTAEQLAHLVEQGYLVRERVLSAAQLARFRDAADTVEAEFGKGDTGGQGTTFDGLFLRNLMDKHPAFLDLLRFAPTLGIARAVLGPQVQVHGTVLRVTYPEVGTQQVGWHFHQRTVPDPLPPFYRGAGVLDNLIYLDDLTRETGPLVVLPGTHRRDEALGERDFADRPGQVVVTCPAGSIVTSHASLWHRALPTLPGGTKRRLVILGYSNVWIKQVDRPGGGLTDALREGADAETRELLGLTGWY